MGRQDGAPLGRKAARGVRQTDRDGTDDERLPDELLGYRGRDLVAQSAQEEQGLFLLFREIFFVTVRF